MDPPYVTSFMSCFCRLVLKWRLHFFGKFAHSFFKYQLFGLIHFSEFKIKLQNLSRKGPVPFLRWEGEGWNTDPIRLKMQHYSEPLGNITATSTTRVHAANTATSANDLVHHYTPTASRKPDSTDIAAIPNCREWESARLIQCTVVNIKCKLYL